MYEKYNWEKGEVVASALLNNMELGIENVDKFVTMHNADVENPHKVTADQLGLSNVKNYSIATSEDAIAGIANDKYMTPFLVSEALKKINEVLENKVSNKDLQRFLSGEEIVVTYTCDFKNKISGSVKENPHIISKAASPTLVSPNDKISEFTQGEVKGVVDLDAKATIVRNGTASNMVQTLVSFDLITDIDRRYPGLFAEYGAATRGQQVAVAKRLLTSINYSLYGFGSGPIKNILYNGIWTGAKFADLISINGTAIGLCNYKETNNAARWLTDDGFIYTIAFAPASDGVTSSVVNLDYASLEYTLAIKMTDIYALRKDIDNLGIRNLFKGYPTNDKLRATKPNGYYYEHNFKALGTRINLEPNTEYVFSWSYSTISGDPGAVSVGYGSDSLGYTQEITQVPTSTGVLAFKTPTVLPYPYFALRLIRSGSPVTGVVADYWDLCLRKGNIKMDWTPAPEGAITTLDQVQMSRITADDGGVYQGISSGSILAIVLANKKGLRNYHAYGAVTDLPSSSVYRFIANMTSDTHGNVSGMDDLGNCYARAIADSKWVGEWQQLVPKYAFDLLEKRVAALEN